MAGLSFGLTMGLSQPLAGGGSSGPFTPLDATSQTLIRWFNWSDTGATNIVQSGNLVSAVADKSAVNSGAAQTTGSRQPDTNTATIGGENALLFDTDDGLLLDAIPTVDGVTIGVVFRTPASFSTNRYLCGATLATVGSASRIRLSSTTALNWQFSGSASNFAVSLVANTEYIMFFRKAAGNNSRLLYIGDGTDVTSNATANNFSLEAIGNDGDASHGLNGAISEFAMWSGGAISDADMNALGQAWSTEYSAAWSDK